MFICQNWQKLILKSPRFVPLHDNLDQLEDKSDIPADHQQSTMTRAPRTKKTTSPKPLIRRMAAWSGRYWARLTTNGTNMGLFQINTEFVLTQRSRTQTVLSARLNVILLTLKWRDLFNVESIRSHLTWLMMFESVLTGGWSRCLWLLTWLSEVFVYGAGWLLGDCDVCASTSKSSVVIQSRHHSPQWHSTLYWKHHSITLKTSLHHTLHFTSLNQLFSLTMESPVHSAVKSNAH